MVGPSATPEFVGQFIDWNGDGIYWQIEWAGAVGTDGKVYIGARCPETGVVCYHVDKAIYVMSEEEMLEQVAFESSAGQWVRAHYCP